MNNKNEIVEEIEFLNSDINRAISILSIVRESLRSGDSRLVGDPFARSAYYDLADIALERLEICDARSKDLRKIVSGLC